MNLDKETVQRHIVKANPQSLEMCLINDGALMHANNPQIIYLHIPKSAGTTWLDVVRRQYNRKKFFKLRSVQSDRQWPEFVQLDPSEKNNFDAFFGHFEFGVHKDLSRPAKYVTILREPVSRVISFYNYMMDRPHSPSWEKRPNSNLSISDFVSQGYSKHARDGQTRLLTGQLKAETLQQDSVELALKNIATHFIAVGVTERFDESLMYFQKKLGWKKHCCYRRKNVSRSPGHDSISEADIEIIKHYNRLDIQLYKCVFNEFQSEIARVVQDIDKVIFWHRLRLHPYRHCSSFGESALRIARLTKSNIAAQFRK